MRGGNELQDKHEIVQMNNERRLEVSRLNEPAACFFSNQNF